jgi:hypothetical protein
MPNYEVIITRTIQQMFSIQIETDTEKEAIKCLKTDIKSYDELCMKDAVIDSIVIDDKSITIRTNIIPEEEEQEEEIDEE